MSVEDGELQVPPGAESDAESFELIRLWVANEHEHVSLRAGVWEDAGAWGLLLADLARHAATAEAQTSDGDPDEILRRIMYAFESEMASPTEEAEGELEE
jgi:hypothetical protein